MITRRIVMAEPPLNFEEDAQRAWYPVYILKGVRYLPHYRNTRYYVGPGFPKHNDTLYKPEELLKAGAVVTQSYLFYRVDSQEEHELTRPMRMR